MVAVLSLAEALRFWPKSLLGEFDLAVGTEKNENAWFDVLRLGW